MSIYKLTCSETGNIYYGSTGNDIKKRREKGWYHCTCKDFVNPKMEVMEHIEDNVERLKKEAEYIQNNECVNVNSKHLNVKEGMKHWVANNKEKHIQDGKDWNKKVKEEKRFYCDICDISLLSTKTLERHFEGYRHKLKKVSYDKYGDEWKTHYLEDNKKRYNESRRKG